MVSPYQFSALQKDLPALVFGFPYESPKRKPAIEVARKNVEVLIGTYQNDGQRVVLFLSDGYLYHRQDKGSPDYLEAVAKDRWFDPAGGRTLSPIRDQNGTVTGIRIKSPWGDTDFTKIRKP